MCVCGGGGGFCLVHVAVETHLKVASPTPILQVLLVDNPRRAGGLSSVPSLCVCQSFRMNKISDSSVLTVAEEVESPERGETQRGDPGERDPLLRLRTHEREPLPAGERALRARVLHNQ